MEAGAASSENEAPLLSSASGWVTQVPSPRGCPLAGGAPPAPLTQGRCERARCVRRRLCGAFPSQSASAGLDRPARHLQGWADSLASRVGERGAGLSTRSGEVLGREAETGASVSIPLPSCRCRRGGSGARGGAWWLGSLGAQAALRAPGGVPSGPSAPSRSSCAWDGSFLECSPAATPASLERWRQQAARLAPWTPRGLRGHGWLDRAARKPGGALRTVRPLL